MASSNVKKRIKPLTYRECAQFNPALTYEEQALVYGITGGIPHYINKLDVRADMDSALLENFFDTSAYLFEEPENLLKQELREPAVYNSIITAIAGGASRSNEISTKTGLESSVCSKYIKVLMDLGILKKETPVTEKPGKKTIYMIEDNFFRFWYRFVPRNMMLISTGRIKNMYDKAVKEFIPDYMGLVFEKMCREYLIWYDENLQFEISEIGQWWGSNPLTHKQVQIDVVGASPDGGEFLIGSCKYRNEKIGTDELGLLKEYASAFRHGGRFHYIIFAKGGFTDELKQLEEKGEVRLVTLEDMYI